MPLSDTKIRNAKAVEKPIKLSDSGGLYLIVTPTGGRWWRLDFRYEGKRKTISMGIYPDVPLMLAQEVVSTYPNQTSNNCLVQQGRSATSRRTLVNLLM